MYSYPYVMQVLGGLAAEAMAGAQLKPEEREMMERARKLLFEHPSHSFRQLNVCHATYCHYNTYMHILVSKLNYKLKLLVRFEFFNID